MYRDTIVSVHIDQKAWRDGSLCLKCTTKNDKNTNC